MPMVGYNVIKDLVCSITRGKNFMSLGMTDFKPVYTNENVTWPKGYGKNDDAEEADPDMEGAEPGSPKDLPLLS